MAGWACSGGGCSAAVFVLLGRCGAVEVWSFAARESAVQVVRSGLHLVPRLAADGLDRPLGERSGLALLAASLLPVVNSALPSGLGLGHMSRRKLRMASQRRS